MYKFSCLLILWMVCTAQSRQEEHGFVQELDFGPIFNSDNSGIASLASNPVRTAILNVDKSQYPHLFDTVVSSSVDSLQRRVAPRDHTFDASSFGFNPIASQGFLPYGKSAKIVAQPVNYHQPQQHNEQLSSPEHRLSPLRYDIRTLHDPNYKVYKPEEKEEGKEILAALQNNPTVSAYFQPAPAVNVEVNHPLKYRKEELIENLNEDENYNAKPYIAGPPRIRRYTGERSQKIKRSDDDEEEDDPYDYKTDYISRPKEFDESPYSSPYKKKKNSDDSYDYPYSYDSSYDHKAYERIKELSEKQAAEIKQNPGNCKEVQKDGMTCMSCKDPKTGGNYESCSYVTEPKNNKYAYSKEKKFDSNDEPDEPEQKSQGDKRAEKYQNAKEDETAPQKFSNSEEEKPSSEYRNASPEADSDDKYKAYYIHNSRPKTSEAIREASDEGSAEDSKAYDYKKSLPEFYTDNEPKKDVEHVLAEFKKKDRSACKKVHKNGMTCFQCIDKNGLKNEECMFVSESAPKQSHLAYQEVKEFTSKPATLDATDGAESKIVTTSSPPVQRSAAYVVTNSNYGKKLKRKKAAQPSFAATGTSPVAQVQPAPKVKRSEGSEIEANAEIVDETNIAPPEDFAGANSQGAFWAETMPRYSADLGVTLPEYMLSRSEHEQSFDEAVAGA